MLHKPLNLKIFALLVTLLALSYVAFFAIVNRALLLNHLGQSAWPEPIGEILNGADASIHLWIVMVILACIVVSACASSFESSVVYAHEEIWTDNHNEIVVESSWHWRDDDDFRINPASGLPMVGSCDVMGNPFGMCNS